jgi:hypothetical protein
VERSPIRWYLIYVDISTFVVRRTMENKCSVLIDLVRQGGDMMELFDGI